jgi:hypothetical protein
MTSPFRFSLYTTLQLSDVAITRSLWGLLNTPLVGPRRYDVVENAEIPFDEGAFETAAQLYEREGTLFVQGSRDSFLASFSRQTARLSTWNFYLNVKALDGKRGEDWLSWAFDLCRVLPILFGYGCSAEEHDAKHKVKRVLQSGGRVTAWVGNSVSEFTEYLPGIYWLTIFGTTLVKHFGRDRLTSLPSTTASEIGAEQIAVRLKEPTIASNRDERLRREAMIAEQLGSSFFFDRNLVGTTFRPVPSLQNELNRDKQN